MALSRKLADTFTASQYEKTLRITPGESLGDSCRANVAFPKSGMGKTWGMKKGD